MKKKEFTMKLKIKSVKCSQTQKAKVCATKTLLICFSSMYANIQHLKVDETSRNIHETSRNVHETSRNAHETSRNAHETSRNVQRLSFFNEKTCCTKPYSALT